MFLTTNRTTNEAELVEIHRIGLSRVSRPTQHSISHFGGGLHSQSLDCYSQTIRKTLNINHKNTHINTIQIIENKQLNIQQKQNYSDSVASYDRYSARKQSGLILQWPQVPHGPGNSQKSWLSWTNELVSIRLIHHSIQLCSS